MRPFCQPCLVGTAWESWGILKNDNVLNVRRKNIVCLYDITICFSLSPDRVVLEGESNFTHGPDEFLGKMIRVDNFVVCVENRHDGAVVIGFRGRPEAFIL